MVDRKLKWLFLGDAKDLLRATDKTEKGLKGVGTESGKAKKGLGGMSKQFGALAAAAAGVGLASWVNEAADLSVAADQVGKSFDETFGRQARNMRDSLEETRRALGLGEDQLEKNLLKFGQLGISMGLVGDENAEFSSSLFTMAGDVAAFNGELDNSEQVLGAFGSALKGEFDALEAFGIVLKQSNVDARALADTGKENASELTNQEKATATLALITEQLADEQGALAEAIGEGQTETNELLSEMRDLQVEGGAAFATIKQALGGFLVGMFDGLRAVGKGFATFIKWLDRVAASGEGLNNFVAQSISEILKLVFGLNSSMQRVRDSWMRFWSQMGVPVRNLSGAIGNLGIKLRNVAAAGRSLLGFASGGVVPGPTGQAQLAVVHGGEQVLTPAQQRNAGGGGGGGIVINVTTGVGDPQAIGQAIVEVLEQYQRTQGPLPLQIRE